MNNNTPSPFSAQSNNNIHLVIAFLELPPAVKKLYTFLLERAELEAVQEFDKENFDQYCIERQRKPFSTHWFTSCLKLLVDQERVRIRRKYRGYAYEVQVSFPEISSDFVKGVES